MIRASCDIAIAKASHLKSKISDGVSEAEEKSKTAFLDLEMLDEAHSFWSKGAGKIHFDGFRNWEIILRLRNNFQTIASLPLPPPSLPIVAVDQIGNPNTNILLHFQPGRRGFGG